jgi:hypothetical protein
MSASEDRLVRLVAIALVVTAVGCASHHAPRPRPPIRPTEWRAVLNDWYGDGVVDHSHPCAAIVLARTHLPTDGMTYSTIDRDLHRAEVRWCTQRPDVDTLRTGMSDADVAAVAGAPTEPGLRCWLYPGRRACFTNGRVTTLQFSVHG